MPRMRDLGERILGSRTVKNVIWNFGGQGLPMVAALFTIPYLIGRLGTDRFGLLSIGWILIGYLSIFDFGLGRAMTRQVAIKLGAGDLQDVPKVFWTAIGAMAALGLVAAGVGFTLAGTLVHDMLRVPANLEEEGRYAFMVLAFGLPVTIVSTGLLGLLEAYQQFRIVGMLRMATGLASYGIPAAVAVATQNIVAVVAALVVARAVIAALGFLVCLTVVESLRRPVRPGRDELLSLLGVGGWMTVSNIVSPIMAGLDRFLLGSLISVAAITYYVTPADALTKATVIPIAITGVLFPIFTGAMTAERSKTLDMFRRSWDVVFLILAPFVIAVVVFAHEALSFWIDPEFADHSAAIAKWIAFGVLANGLALLPYAMLQATTKARTVAMIHLVELPLYVVSVWLLVDSFGIVGAAIAWTLRVTVDLVALFWATSRLMGSPRLLVSPLWRFETALTLVVVVLALVDIPALAGIIVVASGVIVCAVLALERLDLGWNTILAATARSSGRREVRP